MLVGLHQVGVAGIVVDHQLVDLLQPVAVALGELLVFHAEPPVRIAGRKAAVGGDGVELVVVDEFEDGREEIQPVVARVLLHLTLDLDQVGRQRDSHGIHAVIDGSIRTASTCFRFTLPFA